MSVAERISSLTAFDFERAGNTIRLAWDRLARVPLGKRVFSILLGRLVPYSGTIGADIVELQPGYARVELRDRRAVRNHLRSVHAIALANLAELCGNLAIAYSMPADARFIVAGFQIEYLKKARGTIIAESRPPTLENNQRREYPVLVEMRDSQGDLVARATMQTLIGPARSSR